jgi:hypothetical protein
MESASAPVTQVSAYSVSYCIYPNARQL